MSSNFIFLNPSKTEFLIIGLPQQLSKLRSPTIHLPNDVTLTPVDSARNLGVIFDNNLTFSQHISAISKPCFHDIRDLMRIHNTIDLTTACTIAIPLSFILKLTIATLYYSIFLLYSNYNRL